MVPNKFLWCGLLPKSERILNNEVKIEPQKTMNQNKTRG